MSPDESTRLAGMIDALWSAERCDWKLAYEMGPGENPWPWTVYLEWTSEYGNPHLADFITYTWIFSGETAETALSETVDWCRELAPWAPCQECDGRGEWRGVACAHCRQTGLARVPVTTKAPGH